ncbi:MAG: ERF family protein [Candidatus Bilamarchaeaceae archaeon]
MEQLELTCAPNVYSALLQARAKFDRIKKEETNSYFNSKYATLDRVLEAVTPGLSEARLLLTHDVLQRDGALLLVTTLLHPDSGTKIETQLPLFFKAGDMQSLGSAITYARRYSILLLLGLATEDDDGNGSTDRKFNDNTVKRTTVSPTAQKSPFRQG